MSIKEYAKEMMAKDQVFRDIADQKETLWVNDKYLPFGMVDAVCQLVVSDADIADAERRLRKFAPYIKKCFPETAEDGGLIESPLKEIGAMKKALEETYDAEIPGRLLLKMDSHLPIAGSVILSISMSSLTILTLTSDSSCDTRITVGTNDMMI